MIGYCDDIYICFSAVFEFSFQNNNGLGSYLQDINPNIVSHSTDGPYGEISIERFIFDNL